MKTRFFFAALLLLAFGSVKAQENENLNAKSLAVMTTGDVTIRQSDTLLVLKDEYDGKYAVQRDVITLWGTADFDVTLPELKSLTVSSTGDVVSHGVLKGSDLTIISLGAGDIELDLDCNDVVVKMSGTGDVTLRGKCHSLTPIVLGKGDLNVKGLLQEDGEVVMNGGYPNSDSATLSELMRELGVNLERLSDSVDWKSFEDDMEKWGADMEKWGADMEEWGRKMEKWGERFEDKHGKNYEYHYEYNNNNPRPKEGKFKGKHPEKKNLLYDAHWNGFEAGLNMLVTPQLADVYVSTGGTNGMELRPLRSWYFGFNIADVGVAFDRRHTVGLFTGIGLGWNNFSWNNDVTIKYDPENVINTLLPVESEQEVKTSKYGALFLQAPLMVEVKPTHGMYIDLGVTAGLRIAQWNRVKYSDGNSDKHYFSGPLNQFKLDASLRVGGSDMGFFANYALLPIFSFGNEQKAHPISFGFSINF